MFTIDRVALSFADARTIEKTCVDRAASEGDPDRYMLEVAGEVADAVVRLASLPVGAHDEDSDAGAKERLRRVAAFVGGGGNGADALYACAILARAGTRVSAFLMSGRSHPRALAAARKAGVRVVDLGGRTLRSLEETPEWSDIFLADAWIDGIVGIGATGPLAGGLAEGVEVLNRFSSVRARPVVAIDVPSGLTDEDGKIAGPILRATHTLVVGSYKRAQVLPPAVSFSGDMTLISLEWDGGGVRAKEGADGTIGAGDLYYVDDACVREFVPVPDFAHDKYARGVVGLVAGSDTYPGAGLLASLGALAGGVGMVRLNSTRRVQDLVLAAQPGVVTVGGRIQAGLIGPGLDEERREDALELAHFCARSGVPLVIDAWALGLVPELVGSLAPEETVLTPHYGEAARLLSQLAEPVTKEEVGASPLRYARALHEATGCHIVLKGPVTITYSFERVDTDADEAFRRALNSAEAWPSSGETNAGQRVCSYGAAVGGRTTSWAGVAGSGDVLAGLLSGMLARPNGEVDASTGRQRAARITPELLSAAVCLHGRAAAVAAQQWRGRAPIQAADIARAILRVLADSAL